MKGVQEKSPAPRKTKETTSQKFLVPNNLGPRLSSIDQSVTSQMGTIKTTRVLSRPSSSGRTNSFRPTRRNSTESPSPATTATIIKSPIVSGTGSSPCPKSRVKKSVSPARVTNIRIVGDLKENSTLTVTGTVIGATGTLESSIVRWFKTSSSKLGNKHDLELLCTIKITEVFRIPVGVVGCYIAVKITPMNSGGKPGEPAYVLSDNAVEPLFPSLSFLSVEGDYTEGEMLRASYEYIGGYEGRSLCSWYLHEDDTESGTLIPGVSGDLRYCITKEAIGRFISFKYIPVRDDGTVGKEETCFGRTRVCPGSPRLVSIDIRGVGVEGATLFTEKTYLGGEEGDSRFQWFCTSLDGKESEITGAILSSYKLSVDDVGFFVSVSCEPVRSDGASGPSVISKSVGPIIPGPPTCHSLEFIGEMVEGKRLSFVASYSGGEKGNCLQEWFRVDTNGTSEKLSTSEFWNMIFTDVGNRIKVVYTPVRKDGQRGGSRSVISDVVLSGIPRMINLEIEGGGFHTNLYAVCGDYSGGREGKSRVQWYREMVGSPDLIMIPGEVDKMYAANVDDVGYKLVAVYTPVREDGVGGEPVSASSEPIAVEPNVFKEVKHKIVDGFMKFEVLFISLQTSKKNAKGGLERRILEMNRKRIKVVKPGSKTSFPIVELRVSYAPPFHVVASRTDQHRLKIMVDAEAEVELVAQMQFLRDVIVLIIRELAQRFNSMSLNSLLQMGS